MSPGVISGRKCPPGSFLLDLTIVCQGVASNRNMKKTTLVALFLMTAAGMALVAQQQEIRIVTTAVEKAAVVGGLAGPLQPMGSGSGVIFGQVTEGDSNRPVAGALV